MRTALFIRPFVLYKQGVTAELSVTFTLNELTAKYIIAINDRGKLTRSVTVLKP